MTNNSELIASAPAQSGDMAALGNLNRVMVCAGWSIEYVDLDLTKDRPTAEIKIQRDDGRWVWARVDSLGRCTTETFHRERSLGMAKNQKGSRPLTPLCDDAFLGRARYEGARSMLRGLTNYIAANAITPVTLGEIRKAWAAVMVSPAKSRDGVEAKGVDAPKQGQVTKHGQVNSDARVGDEVKL